jgi:transglutaminase-like putative cysteine protease
MPQFNIHHITRYIYEAPVGDSANQVMLFALKDEYQQVINHQLTITGDPAVDIYTDYYGNQVGSFMYTRPHTELLIDSQLEVMVTQRPPPANDQPVALQWAELDSLAVTVPYIDFLAQEQFAALPEVMEMANALNARSLTIFEAVNLLTTHVYEQFHYIKGVTTVESTPDEIWRLKAGVCQDFAHILLVMLRMLRIPARYVSGYICPQHSGMRGEGATHAWAEAYLPFYGWLGFDPTNNCIAGEQHVRLAVGRSFRDCSPVKGTYKGSAGHELQVGVSVSYEDGSVLEDAATVLAPQPPVSQGGTEKPVNSWRLHMEMMQQQQQ